MLPAASPPSSSGGGGLPSPRAEGADQSARRTSQQHTPPPRHHASPPSEGDGRCRQGGSTATRPPPHHAASPSTRVDGRLAGGAADLHHHLHLSLPAYPSFSCAAPSWASVVRDGARPRNPPQATLSASPAIVSRDDFITLYERCVESGIRARFAVRYTAGRQEVSLSASLSPPLSAFVAPVPRV
jgi:hypothetical protein